MKRIYVSKYSFRKLLSDISLNEFRDKNKHPLQETPPNYIWRTTYGESWSTGNPLGLGVSESRKRTIRKCKLNKK